MKRCWIVILLITSVLIKINAQEISWELINKDQYQAIILEADINNFRSASLLTFEDLGGLFVLFVDLSPLQRNTVMSLTLNDRTYNLQVFDVKQYTDRGILVFRYLLAPQNGDVAKAMYQVVDRTTSVNGRIVIGNISRKFTVKGLKQ